MMIIRSRHDPVEAFTRVELLLIISSVVALGILWCSHYSSDKAKSRLIYCNNNLKQVGLAFKTWSPDQSDVFPMRRPASSGGTLELTNSSLVFRTFLVLSNELIEPALLICPEDSRKPATNFGAEFSSNNVSYFVGLDASEEDPESLLSGDRNITNGIPLNNGLLLLPTNFPAGWNQQFHNGIGNVSLGDGSVQILRSTRLWQQFCAAGTATNRLMMP